MMTQILVDNLRELPQCLSAARCRAVATSIWAANGVVRHPADLTREPQPA
jgi:hypothetical protein